MRTSDTDISITAHQCAMARSFLGWSQAALSRVAGLPVRTVRDFESGISDPAAAELAMLRYALEEGGIVFTAGPGGVEGIRLRRPDEPVSRPAHMSLH